MRSREHLGNSQHIQMIDGTKNRRELTPMDWLYTAGVVGVLAPPAFILGLSVNQRMDPIRCTKELIKLFGPQKKSPDQNLPPLIHNS